MKKEIMIGDKAVLFSASADTPRLYRIIFQRDLIKDMQSIDIKNIDMTAVEQIAYAMAKEGDREIPNIDEWLSQFGIFDLYQALPEIIQLWGFNTVTASQSKKKQTQRQGK